MNDISKAIYDIRKIDELGDIDTRIHKINSSIKIIVTIIKGYNTVHVIFITVNCFIDSIFIT